MMPNLLTTKPLRTLNIYIYRNNLNNDLQCLVILNEFFVNPYVVEVTYLKVAKLKVKPILSNKSHLSMA